MTTAGPPLADLLDSVRGLPTHALLVHFTVVVATVGTIAGLGFALIPPFRRWLSGPLVATGTASVVLGLITPPSGERLEARTPPSALLEEHTRLGGQMGTIMIAYGILLILAVAAVRYRRRSAVPESGTGRPTTLDRIGGLPGEAPRAFPGQPQIAALLTVLVLAGAVVSGIWIFRTGEAGARSVWHGTVSQAPR
jgi:hypothetical protein